MKKLLYIILFILSISTSLHAKVTMRVLLSSQKHVQIIPQTINTNKIYGLKINNKTLKVRGKLSIAYHSQGFVVNKKILKGKKLDIIGIRAAKVDNTAYRGSLSLHHQKNKITIINNVDLEEYLFSVVPSEVYLSWNLETLKAQAVAARTYALFENQRRRKGIFDVYKDTRSQVYKGISVENRKTSQAVLLTKGQILTYQGKLIKSYFSSSIGGMSAAGYEIGDNKPYLKPVKSYHAKGNPNKLWSLKIPLKKIQQQYKTSKIQAINVSHTSSGRIKQIHIKDSRGKTTKIRGDSFRSKIGANTMKSTRARMKVYSGNLYIKGTGFGHGVGMGQWEAQELARRGARYYQILLHFYQGTKIKKLY